MDVLSTLYNNIFHLKKANGVNGLQKHGNQQITK